MHNEHFQMEADGLHQDIRSVRGDFFEPRPFWEQSIEKIEKYLDNELKNHNIENYLDANLYERCSLSDRYLEELEEKLENDVEEKLKDFAREHGIDPNSYNFKDSLMIGRNPEDHIDLGFNRIKITKTTPLLTYFQAWYDLRYGYIECF